MRLLVVITCMRLCATAGLNFGKHPPIDESSASANHVATEHAVDRNVAAVLVTEPQESAGSSFDLLSDPENVPGANAAGDSVVYPPPQEGCHSKLCAAASRPKKARLEDVLPEEVFPVCGGSPSRPKKARLEEALPEEVFPVCGGSPILEESDQHVESTHTKHATKGAGDENIQPYLDSQDEECMDITREDDVAAELANPLEADAEFAAPGADAAVGATNSAELPEPLEHNAELAAPEADAAVGAANSAELPEPLEPNAELAAPEADAAAEAANAAELLEPLEADAELAAPEADAAAEAANAAELPEPLEADAELAAPEADEAAEAANAAELLEPLEADAELAAPEADAAMEEADIWVEAFVAQLVADAIEAVFAPNPIPIQEVIDRRGRNVGQ